MTTCHPMCAAGLGARRRTWSSTLAAVVTTLTIATFGAGCSSNTANSAARMSAGQPNLATSNGAASKGATSATESAHSEEPLTPGVSLVATAGGSSITVRETPGGKVLRTMANPTPIGGPLTFLVLDRRPGWVLVQLPVRPNGSSGWVTADQVSLARTPYRLVVSLAKHQLTVLRDGRPTATYPVGVGVALTPTPPGTYYLTELLAPPDPTGAYGPYAFGLSAFSPTLTSFAGGPGQLGLHGTNAPQGLGKDVSHGCLRVANAVITALARSLPLGTPIDIR